MTRACRDCKWAKLHDHVVTGGKITVQCSRMEQDVRASNVCAKWEPWAEMEVDFDLREEFRALADRINEGGNR